MDYFAPRLMLVTPPLPDETGWAQRLVSACQAGDVGAVLLRLAPGDERGQINIIKAVAPAIQTLGIAVIAEAEPQIAVRGGADGVHIHGTAEMIKAARKALPDGRTLGAGMLRSRHDAMDAGEAGVDYVMFGEPRLDGFQPPLSGILDRAQWWAEIFQTPCVAFAHDLDMVVPLCATNADFIALGEWIFATDEAAKHVQDCMSAISSYAPIAQTG